jgi:hypothetical protein
MKRIAQGRKGDSREGIKNVTKWNDNPLTSMVFSIGTGFSDFNKARETYNEVDVERNISLQSVHYYKGIVTS